MTGGGTPRTLKLLGQIQLHSPVLHPGGGRGTALQPTDPLGAPETGRAYPGPERNHRRSKEKKELQRTRGARGLPAPARVGRTFPSARAGGGPASRSSRGSPGARKAPRPGACCYTAGTTRTLCTLAAAPQNRPGRPPHHALRVNKPLVGGARRSSANGRAGDLQGGVA